VKEATWHEEEATLKVETARMIRALYIEGVWGKVRFGLVRFRYLKYVFVSLILADIVYTFLQNYHVIYIDGDMAGVIVPSDFYRQVLLDPFGFSVLFKHKVYAAPNRFFAHALVSGYFKSFPLLFQTVASPINSIYLSMAFARTLAQVLLIGLIAAFICGHARISSKKFITAALIITPLFQVSGYDRFMGVTDISSTYTFCYAGWLIFVLLYFLPFYKPIFNRSPLKFSVYQHIWMVVLALIIAFGGPLASPIILLVCPSVLIGVMYVNFKKENGLNFFKRSWASIAHMPLALLFHFCFIIFCCVYSFYIGLHNIENQANPLSIAERYRLLPMGLKITLWKNTGVPLLISTCLLNFILVRHTKQENAKRITQLIYCLGLFSIIYLLLLPLGGYRAYRPYVIRYDTFSPVTLCLIFTFGLTSIYLIKHYKGIAKMLFITLIAVVMLFFTKQDKIYWGANYCERKSLADIAASPDKIVYLTDWCNVMSWERITDYHRSEVNCHLLKYWGVIKEDKLYYQSIQK
jgi:hypothetical protein